MTHIWIYYLMGINLFSFSLMGLDKAFAVRKKRRISEKTLHLFSIVGGTLGTVLAMWIFRHKVRKKMFVFITGLALAVQLLVVVLAHHDVLN